ncbi:MAG: hypothetical protein NZ889_03000, partial [Candidatus Pacearchaeota archaeon]|nr:hypothetical protein [Candidatus Pacearchaeota archaeon]
LWPDMQEFCLIIQEPLFEITRASMSQLLEYYILHRLPSYNEIAERKPTHEEISERKKRKPVEGAFVLQPKAGLYENLAIFDFTSMHTSIIVSFNISKSTLLDRYEKDAYETPWIEWHGKKTKFYFTKRRGFLPEMCKELIKKRKEYKQQYKKNPSPITKARSNAFKLLTAAVHGYFGFFGARYYSLEASASVLAFVRKFNMETIEKVKEAGYEVIYSDTDSIAFCLGKKSKKDVLDLLRKLNSELPEMMELELEDFYVRGIWVTKRTKEFGAKKKYALITEDGKIKIRGFETVRRDWCKLARKVQDTVLEMILKDGRPDRALEYVRRIIKEVKEKRIDKKEMIILTQLKKTLESYESVGPHVEIARKMKALGIPVEPGMMIEFIIAETKNKKSLIRERAKLPEEVSDKGYDSNYYIEHQIIPAVENIFEIFSITKEDILGKGQKKLLEF